MAKAKYKGNSDVGYLQLPDHPGKGTVGCVVKTVRVLDIVADHKGTDVYLDYDKDGTLIGIELLLD
ncbi:MAG: DUF2283 domain-containing protein [Pseudomonadota bacterium]